MSAQVLLTEPQAAKALQVCVRSLRKARQDGRLTYVLIGKSVRYTMEDLRGFIEASRQDAKPCRKPTPRTNAGNRAGNIVPFTERRA
ncbi:helix-turn-helix domain-containing protein [Altererythrobacter sp. H2]|uniref:helix-turn-helix domain-containing protein n=1 Tax=Altererythrobacter sp. H2 TaxID=3108391 RepID=UPI002B4BB333|nr:helix-turn-helix domain-containing protein [Altererythrobacter sp. H2]WRK96726.1 helix-turn-helix domain-containing protein [Altererythrobacter sp. H2]